MKNLIGKLFGADKVIDAGIAAGDAMFFTPEEKAKWKLQLLKAYEPFKLAQRMLMLVICPAYVLMTVGTWVATFWGVDVESQWRLLNGDIGTAFWLVVGFYFGGGMLEGAINAQKAK